MYGFEAPCGEPFFVVRVLLSAILLPHGEYLISLVDTPVTAWKSKCGEQRGIARFIGGTG